MKNPLALFGCLIMAGTMVTYSQNHTEVFIPSQNFYHGSARSQAMAGSFGSLGGDYISTSINPAGIGVYRSNEFAFTSSLKVDLANASYLGSEDLGLKGNLGIDNISYVRSFNRTAEKGLVGFNIAIGYNRLNDYYRKTNIRTEQAVGSLLDEFTHNANNQMASPFWEDLAWYTDLLYLRNTVTDELIHNSTYEDGMNLDNTVYTNDFEMYNNQYGQYLGYNINEHGRMGEFSLASAFNISHKLYLGASLAIQNYQYSKKATNYEETTWDQFAHNNFSDTALLPFESFTFTEDLYTSGRGFNAKVGAIYRPIRLLRVGASFHTPTYMFMESEYRTSMDATFHDWDGLLEEYTDRNINKFAIKTPFKAIGSVGFHIGKIGVVNVDYEYVDYTSMKIFDVQQSGALKKANFDDVNNDISEIYQAVGNIRVGAEARLNPLYLRAGYGYYPSPMKADFGKINRSHYAGGIGFRFDQAYIDLTYLLNHVNYHVYPYSGSPNASVDAYTHRLVATLGFRF